MLKPRRTPKDGTGKISTADLEEGLRQLKVFEGMSKEQASLATRRFDRSGDGTVSLCDFLAFAGRPYAANDRPLEAKLRRVLLKAEAVRADNGGGVECIDHSRFRGALDRCCWSRYDLQVEDDPWNRPVMLVDAHA